MKLSDRCDLRDEGYDEGYKDGLAARDADFVKLENRIEELCDELGEIDAKVAELVELLEYISFDFDPEFALGPPCGPDVLEKINKALTKFKGVE